MPAKPMAVVIVLLLFYLWTATIPCSCFSTARLRICKLYMSKSGDTPFPLRNSPCVRFERQFVQEEVATGKHGIYMRKLWNVFTHVKNQPGSTNHIARIRRPKEVNLAQSSTRFSWCNSANVKVNKELHDDYLTRLELVVPHNHMSDELYSQGAPVVSIQVNGATVEPTEAIIAVNGTLAFDLTFLAANGTKCQSLKVTYISRAQNVRVPFRKTFICEYFNVADDTFEKFRNLTRTMTISTTKNKTRSTITRLQARPKRQTTRCRELPLYADFHNDLGMRWILYPRRVNIGQCTGMCSRSPDIYSASGYKTARSILLNNFQRKVVCGAGHSVSCVPNKLEPKVFLYTPDFELIVIKTFSAVTIRSCRCV